MVQGIFLQYILLPLIALVLAALMSVIAKVNPLLSNKQLIIFTLVNALVVGIPGLLGISGNDFSPWYYLVAQLIYLFIGIGFMKAYNRYFHEKVKMYKTLFQVLLLSTIMVLGGFTFALIFNWLSNIHNGYVAASCILTLPLPLIFYWTYIAFIDIPFDIYNVWQYPMGSAEINFDGLDFNKLMVLELEFGKRPDDLDRLKVKAKAPADMPFGEWFKKFIDDYNYKFPNQSIVYTDKQGEPHGWIFYVKKSFFHKKRLLDPNLSVEQNRIKEHITIISKRVIEHKEEGFTKQSQQKLILEI